MQNSLLISYLLGLEVFNQVPLQIVLLLLAKTATPTTEGLEALFKQDSFFGIPMDPVVALGLSIGWSMRSCIGLHLKAISVDKGFFPMKSKIVVWIWGLFGTLHRILAMVAFFIPFFGLFDVLFHWRTEQIPFRVR